MTVRGFTLSSRSALAAPAFLVLATGCSSATAEPSSRKEADVPVVSSVGEEARRLVLPFDAYAISTPQIHTIESAEDLLIRDCMREHGRGWNTLPGPSGIDWAPSNRRRYGLIESEIAARFGYHLPPTPQELTRREAVWDARKKLPEREQLAAFGKKGGAGAGSRRTKACSEGLRNPTSPCSTGASVRNSTPPGATARWYASSVIGARV
ncbi:hypothetical protein [Streptomyces inhibens]|uniref:hypothetical protein n=1 Tax=Streptomyces inhibens TaxID=2293571 RepID=UPI000FFC5EC6|nr:hypothetical protein [Streptomyces inhibens]